MHSLFAIRFPELWRVGGAMPHTLLVLYEITQLCSLHPGPVKIGAAEPLDTAGMYHTLPAEITCSQPHVKHLEWGSAMMALWTNSNLTSIFFPQI